MIRWPSFACQLRAAPLASQSGFTIAYVDYCCSAKLDPAMRNELEQFSAQPAGDDGRRHFTQWQSTRWRMFRKTVPEWADALSVTPPETAAEARVRWEFLKVCWCTWLQINGLAWCTAVQWWT